MVANEHLERARESGVTGADPASIAACAAVVRHFEDAARAAGSAADSAAREIAAAAQTIVQAFLAITAFMLVAMAALHRTPNIWSPSWSGGWSRSGPVCQP